MTRIQKPWNTPPVRFTEAHRGLLAWLFRPPSARPQPLRNCCPERTRDAEHRGRRTRGQEGRQR